MFDWIPFYTKLADKLLPMRAQPDELMAFVNQLRDEGLKVQQMHDMDAAGNKFSLAEIDPFTFFAIFNRAITDENRIRILERVRVRFNIDEAVPTAFLGLPTMNNQKSWFFGYQSDRAPGDIGRLWDVFDAALGSDPMSDAAFATAFDSALLVKQTSFNLTMGLFWIRPMTFLALDKNMREFLHVAMPKDGLSFDFYRKTIASTRMGYQLPFPELSLRAVEPARVEELPKIPSTKIDPEIDYWMVGAYWDSQEIADQTERFLNEGIWENGHAVNDLEPTQVKSMKVGDRLAIKSTAVRKLGLPFEYAGATASLMRVKLTGTIIANHEDGRSVEVEWDEPFDPPREWYFYTQRSTIWKLRKDDERARRLIQFAFYGADQDYGYFLGNRIPDGPEVVIDAGDGDVAVAQAPPYDIADLMAEGVFLEEVQIEQWLRNLRLKKNLILQGAPGVGKTFLALRLAYVLMQAKDKDRVTLVQFHPSYSYEDFVRGYRPTAEVGKFGLVDGPFLEICKKATADPDREYVLIIDEVNRGNLSQIFGELIMLLEADKRGPAYAVSPLYRKTEQEQMQIPSNLYVIGTMNIADRSLALVDYALRRRFAFASLEPQFSSSRYRSWLENRGMPNELVHQIITRMTTLNETIAEDPHLGPAYRIGHSFFCPTGKDFSGLNSEWYSEIILTEIQPLLEAYWYDNLDKASASCKELHG